MALAKIVEWTTFGIDDENDKADHTIVWIPEGVPQEQHVVVVEAVNVDGAVEELLVSPFASAYDFTGLS